MDKMRKTIKSKTENGIGGKKERGGRQLSLQLMMLPGTALLIIFCIIPLVGVWMAFSKYQPQLNMSYFQALFKGDFVGFGFFEQIFNRPDFLQVVRNTVVISFVKIALLIVLGVALALLLNELPNSRLQKVVQTIIFIPYFLSWTIISSVLVDLLSLDGPINNVITSLGGEGISFLADNNWFRVVIYVSEMWKSLGYQAIYFMAAIISVDAGLYEAAQIDGAGRVKQCFHVTIPCIMPVIILMSVLNLGNVMSAGFDQIVSLYSPLVYESGDIIDTMAYRIGLLTPSKYQYSLGTAIGVFKSVISCIFFGAGYVIAKKKFDYRIL